MASERCSAKNKSGDRCKAWAVRGTKRCVLHSGKDVAKLLGARGGRRRTVFDPEQLAPIEPPQNAADLLRLVATTIVDVRSARLEPKVANALFYGASAFLAALQISDLAERVAALEAKQELMRKAAL